MITKEQARLLKREDAVHHSTWTDGQGNCEVWLVGSSYFEENGWGVSLYRQQNLAGISENRMKEWHLPKDCSRHKSKH